MFLISLAPFQRLVREVCEEDPQRIKDEPIRWQSNALFTLQTSTEAYMSGFFNDVNLCVIHRKVKMISQKDIDLAIEIRGTQHVGGKKLSDVGPGNISRNFASDASERRGLPRAAHRADLAMGHDWSAKLRAKAAAVPVPVKKGRKGKAPQKLVLKGAVHGISKASFCRLARCAGVQRMSGLIYKEVRGVLKQFLESVIKDVIIFTQYCHRKTVTPMDVIFALKQHGRNVYGFT